MFTIQLFIGLHTILETVQSTMTAFYQRLYSDIALIVRNAVYRDCFVGDKKVGIVRCDAFSYCDID